MGPWISETLVTVMRLTLVLFRTKFNQNELRISGDFSGSEIEVHTEVCTLFFSGRHKSFDSVVNHSGAI